MHIFKKQKYSHIVCDEPGCDVRSPPAKDVLEGHGLVNMGWHCSGGTHFCPAHAPKAK
jgi:hypothetical protein